jgi:hypothetical protein
MRDILLDQSSLPEDGRKVRWNYEDGIYQGTYIMSEEMFLVGGERGEPHFARFVDSWEYIEE